MSVRTDLDAFNTDHRRCGELEAGVDGPVVWIACDWGPAWPGEWTRMRMPAASGEVPIERGRRTEPRRSGQRPADP